MSAYKCTYDEYLDTPNEAVTALLAVRRAYAKGQKLKHDADMNKGTGSQPHIG